jgi:predicted transcriptional regulator
MCLKSFYTLVTSVNKKNFLFNTAELPSYSYILKANVSNMKSEPETINYTFSILGKATHSSTAIDNTRTSYHHHLEELAT